MLHRIADLLCLRPMFVVTGLLVVTVAAGIAATQIRFEFSPQSLFRGDDELVEQLQEFKETFVYEDSVLMVVQEATGDRDLVDKDILTWQASLVERLETIPHVLSCASLATIEVPRRTLRIITTPVVSAPLISRFPAEDEDEQRVRQMLQRSPLVTGTLISEHRRVGAVLIFVDPRLQAVEELARVVEDVEDVLAVAPTPDDLRVSLSGLPHLRTGIVEGLKADQVRLLPIAATVYLIALTLAFRRISCSLLPLLAVGMGLVWTIGFMVTAGFSFNLITNVLPVLLLVIGISNCVHFMDDFADQLSAARASTGNDAAGEMTGPPDGPTTTEERREASRRTILHMGRACLLTLLTTAIGFSCLIAARSDALSQFGWQAALGMSCLYVAIIGTLGSLIRFCRAPRRSSAGAPLGHMTAVAGHVIDHHPKTTLAVSVVLIGGALWFARGVSVNSFTIETFAEDHPTIRTLRVVENELSGLLPIEIQLAADDPERLVDSDVYRRVLEFEERALAQEGVLFARSYAAVLQAIAAGTPRRQEDRQADPDALSDEDLQRAIRRSLWVVQRVGESLGYPNFMSQDQRRGRILIKVRDIGTRDLQHLIERLESDLEQTFPAEFGIRFHLTGDAYVNTLAMNVLIRDLFFTLLTAAVIIFLTIWATFRSLRTGLIAAVPNITPLALTLGYMGLRDYDMNVSNVVVFTISLGIAVDNSIHFLFRFREEVRRTDDVELAVDRSYEGTGRAIVITSLLIVSGLSVLLLSEFVPTRRFAELTSVTMIGALIGDLLLLPACLVLFWQCPSPAKTDEAVSEQGV